MSSEEKSIADQDEKDIRGLTDQVEAILSKRKEQYLTLAKELGRYYSGYDISLHYHTIRFPSLMVYHTVFGGYLEADTHFFKFSKHDWEGLIIEITEAIQQGKEKWNADPKINQFRHEEAEKEKEQLRQDLARMEEDPPIDPELENIEE